MTKDEVNRKLHEFMGLCWHEFPTHLEVTGDPKCKRRGCRVTRYDHTDNPDYCSSDSPRRLLEGVVAKVPFVPYMRALAELLISEMGGIDEAENLVDAMGEMACVEKTMTATAEQIAQACVACITSGNPTTSETMTETPQPERDQEHK